MSQWDREGINERLKELIEVEKVSFADARNVINGEFRTSFSRSAVIARACRVGIKAPEDRRKWMGSRRARPKLTGVAEQHAIRKIVAPRIEYPPVNDDDIPLEQRKTLMELTSETCRWPVGEGANLFFCGALPLIGHPYCGAHCARAYSKPQRLSDEDRERRHYHGLRITQRYRTPGEPIVSPPIAAGEAA